MSTSTISAEFAAFPITVWNIVTDNRNTGWRSDLERVECLSETEFTECAKGALPPIFESQRCNR